MCDTIVALGNSTSDGSVIFGKNSDRQPNEPHIMVRVPRKKHDLSVEKNLNATYIQIPQVEDTNEVILLKPSWIWGCEMGWNEFGLNIGNEAVFTKEKYNNDGLTGMDMIRIALERCKSSKEAVDLIVNLLETYGQGGNCGYEKQFTYHNSFLIADMQSAWVLETAGQYWAAKQITDIYCISNCLTIENDFDICHPDLVKHAVDKGWCKGEKDFNFSECYSDGLYTYFSGSKKRRNACETALENEKGHIGANTIKALLRSHNSELNGKLFKRHSIKSVCMHGGGLIGDQTTGSYIASLNDKKCTYWVTGASAPCISVFKPLWLTETMPVFNEDQQDDAITYWKARERLHRMILAGVIDLDPYMEERNRLEKNFDNTVENLAVSKVSESELTEVSLEAFKAEDELINKVLSQYDGSTKELKTKGNWYFNHYWMTQNRKL